jgi:hypothetical protein
MELPSKAICRSAVRSWSELVAHLRVDRLMAGASRSLRQGTARPARKHVTARSQTRGGQVRLVAGDPSSSYGFNHGAAIRSFEQAAKLDPSCAMAYWGIAYANGPHVNFPLVPPPMAEAAWKNLQLAKQNAAKCTDVEKDLIEALSMRYANPQPEDRSPLDKAYADAMRKVWQKHPDDADVGAWFAESMMDLSPWNQWTKDGSPNPGTTRSSPRSRR